jgi:hypothetical protein
MKTKKNKTKPIHRKDWADIVNECRDAGLSFREGVEEVFYSDDGISRAIILKRKDNAFEIVYESLHALDDEELLYSASELQGVWEPAGSGKTIIDTLEHAEKIIREEAWPT